MAYPTTRFTNNGDWLLLNNQQFQAGDYLLSPGGRFRLTMTEDSQLVLFEDGNPIWTADNKQPFSVSLKRPKEKGPAFFYIANSGFLLDPPRKTMWVAEATHSKDKSRWHNTHLTLQIDGNLVILDMRRIWPVTDYQFFPSLLFPVPIPEGEFLEVGKHYSIGTHYLLLAPDGNMAIFTAANEFTWQSGTYTEGGTKAVMQADGNFVIRNHGDVVLWQTGTAGWVDAWPYIQPNGHLVMMNTFPVWARFGFAPGRTHRKKFFPTLGEFGKGYPFKIFEW
jgi:hypothetical protein